MMRSLFVRAAAVAAGATVLTAVLAAPASAHVTVNPGTAAQGGHARVTFRVPNESDTADTTRVEVNLPTDTPIASVSLKPLPGWAAVAQKTKLPAPVTTAGGEVTEAVTKIIWTAAAGSAVKAGQFQEFDVSLGPLPVTGQVVFKTLQTYSDGTIVRWIDLPTTDGTEPEHPAPVLTLTATAGETPASAAPATEVAAEVAGGTNDDDRYGIAGIAIALAALVAGLLAYRRAGQVA